MDEQRQVIVNEMRACARRRGLTLEDAFIEYDPKQTGSIPYAQYRKVLSYLGFWFDESKLSATTGPYTSGSTFRYKEFISTTGIIPLRSAISDRTLIKFGLTLKARGLNVRDWFEQLDPLHTGRITSFNFARAFRGEEVALQEICEAYKFPTTPEVDYPRLARDIDRLLANRTQVSVEPPSLPACFGRVVEAVASSRVDPLGSFLLVDRFKRTRITAEQFKRELETFRVSLSAAEWRDLVTRFSDEDGVDYGKFCEEFRKESANLARADAAPAEDLDATKILANLAETYRNRHSQLEQTLQDSDPNGTGRVPLFRFFRALTVAQFNISQRERSAIEREFKVDDTTIDYQRFLDALAPPAAPPPPDLRARLREFLHTRFIHLRPILERFDARRSGTLTVADLLAALRTISFDVGPGELQRLKQLYGLSARPSVDIAAFCADIDYAPAPPPAPPAGAPVALAKPVYADRPPRAPPPAEVVAALDRVAAAVAEFRIELFTDFRGMDGLRQGVVPLFRFRNHLTNLGIRAADIERIVAQYPAPAGVDWQPFLEDLRAYGAPSKARTDLSPDTKQLLMLIKTQILVHQTSVESLFYRYDSSRTCRVLKTRVPGILEDLGLRAAPAQVRALCDDFADPKLPEYVGYKAIVDYVDALQIGDDELRSVQVNASNATIDREIASMLNAFREKLVARHRAPADGFRGCKPGGIPPQEFRDGLIALGLYLKEADLQKLMRKYRCNMRADVDWGAFCRDIESSKTLDGGY
jgi:Ca2+-binding EF-hand superfamily protein